MTTNALHHGSAGVGIADVALAIEHLGAERAQCVQRLAGRDFIAHAADGQIEAVGNQGGGDTEADAARTTGDQGHRTFAVCCGHSHYTSSGTSTQRRSFHDCMPSSANCTPLAPSISE